MASIPFAALAQNLKVENIIPLETSNSSIDFPVDLNGKKCEIIDIKLNNDSVVF